jgi:hypothetical protein
MSPSIYDISVSIGSGLFGGSGSSLTSGLCGGTADGGAEDGEAGGGAEERVGEENGREGAGVANSLSHTNASSNVARVKHKSAAEKAAAHVYFLIVSF